MVMGAVLVNCGCRRPAVSRVSCPINIQVLRINIHISIGNDRTTLPGHIMVIHVYGCF